jgi:hypothetical protein
VDRFPRLEMAPDVFNRDRAGTIGEFQLATGKDPDQAVPGTVIRRMVPEVL